MRFKFWCRSCRLPGPSRADDRIERSAPAMRRSRSIQVRPYGLRETRFTHYHNVNRTKHDERAGHRRPARFLPLIGHREIARP